MALQLKPTQSSPQPIEVEEYVIVEQRQMMTQRLENSKEIDDIVSTINVYEPQQLVVFGADAAEGISKCSDQVLNSVDMAQINDSGELLKTLGKIMDKFDLQEIASNEKKGYFGKTFWRSAKTIGTDIGKVSHYGRRSR